MNIINNSEASRSAPSSSPSSSLWTVDWQEGEEADGVACCLVTTCLCSCFFLRAGWVESGLEQEVPEKSIHSGQNWPAGQSLTPVLLIDVKTVLIEVGGV